MARPSCIAPPKTTAPMQRPSGPGLRSRGAAGPTRVYTINPSTLGPAPQKARGRSRLRASLQGGLALLFLVWLGACAPKPQDSGAYAGAVISSQEMRDGLVVQILKTGEGPKAQKGDHAKIHYIARIQGGPEIARSHHASPKYVLVGRDAEYVEGLHLGLLGMQKGELRRIIVPKNLGYRGRKDPKVPPEATLEFLVEMFGLSKNEYE